MTQRILVTAGAAGIGRAIAEAFLADGADVAICDVDSDQLAAMQEAALSDKTRLRRAGWSRSLSV